jgi:hypothetical protein
LLKAIWDGSDDLRAKTDIHIVLDDHMLPRGSKDADTRFYPINTLRNVALKGVRSDWIIYLEGDMRIDANTRSRLDAHVHDHFLAHKGRPHAYIVPLFYEGNDTDVSSSEMVPFPQNTGALLDLIPASLNPYSKYSHSYFKLYKWSFLYRGWLSGKFPSAGTTSNPYEHALEFGMEPYFVAEAAMLPAYDQHMVCYRDKVHQLYLMRLSGFRFFILSDAFIINHEEPRIADLGADSTRDPSLPALYNLCDSEWSRARVKSWTQFAEGSLAHSLVCTLLRTHYNHTHTRIVHMRTCIAHMHARTHATYATPQRLKLHKHGNRLVRRGRVVSALLYALVLASLVLVALFVHFLLSYRREIGFGACFLCRSRNAQRKRVL